MLFILSNSFGQINLTNGLVGYFPLNNSTVDLSPLQQNGIGFFIQPTNGVLGHPNNAYFFNGNNSHIDFGTSNRGVNYIVTISAWFKTTSHNYEWIVGQYDWQQDSGYHVAVQNDRLFLAGRNGTGNYIRVDSNVNVVDGKWHHVLAEINNNTWSIWVDCQFYNTVSSVYNPDITPNNIDLSVGYYPVGDNGYHCYKGNQRMGKHMIIQKNWDCVPCDAKGCNNSGISNCLVKINYLKMIEYLNNFI